MNMKDKQINAKVTYPTLGVTVDSTGQDIHRDENVEVIVHVNAKASGHAYYEFYDVQSGGDKYYAEGSLEIDGGKLVDYDGVSSLPTVIMDILRDDLGVDVSECYDDDGQPNDYELFKYHVDGKAFDVRMQALFHVDSLGLDKEANRTMMNSIQEL